MRYKFDRSFWDALIKASPFPLLDEKISFISRKIADDIRKEEAKAKVKDMSFFKRFWAKISKMFRSKPS